MKPAFATWSSARRPLAGPGRPRAMGILNLTPDSFSDGGRVRSPEHGLELARGLVSDGADILDLGGESSRPGALPVPLDEELRRVLPVLDLVAGALDVPISIDTTKAAVARRAIGAGASVINDITGLAGDPEMERVAVETGSAVVVMHMRGDPRTMQDDPRYDDVVEDVYAFLARRVERLESLGIPRERIAVDPGIGFGKRTAHNVELLRNLPRFAGLGCALLVGASRKGFLGKLAGRPPGDRAVASAVSALAAAEGGAGIVRVHDVAATVDAFRVWAALRPSRRDLDEGTP